MARGDRLFKPLAILASLTLVGFIAYAVVSATSRPSGSFPAVPPASRLSRGEHAPSFVLPRLGGGASVSYRAPSAEPVVVNFFASWCANCVAELDAFASVSAHSPATRFLGIDSEDPDRAVAARLLHRAGIRYAVGIDGSGTIASRYLVSALPVTFFISERGTIVRMLFGQASAAALRAGILALRASSR